MARDETDDARAFLASRLDELWRAAGSPLLDRVARKCLAGRAAGPVTGKRISAWKTGDNVPRSFEELSAVINILTMEARRHVSTDSLTPGLFDQQRWRLWWQQAQQSPSNSRNRHEIPHQKRIGQPLTQIVNPYDMEIQPTIEISEDATELSKLTTYVRRAHDHQLQHIISMAKAQSDVVVLVGDSSTGKTRACWEAICTLPPTWHVWHPLSPSPPEALWEALNGELIGPRTVLWLNELSVYLNTPESQLGERIAAKLRDLLRSPKCSPVLAIGTLWRDQWDALTRYPGRNAEDRHAQARSLLRNHEIAVPEQFSESDLIILRTTCAQDARMMEAANRSDGKVTQFLAGAFELARRYNLAPPSAHAVITAAMDIKRLGRRPLIAEDFLLAVAQGYLDDDAWNQLTDDWGSSALEYATRRCLGVPGPLTKVRHRLGQAAPDIPSYRLSDFLEQQSHKARRFSVPPESFWVAFAEHASTTEELHDLAIAAESRARFRWAAIFYLRMAYEGNLEALQFLADHRLSAGDELAAGALLREAAERGHTEAWADLARLEEAKGNVKAAEELLEKAGSDAYALAQRARLRTLIGDSDGAQALLEIAAAQGTVSAKRDLAIFLETHELDVDRARKLRAELGEDNIIDRLISAADAVRRADAAMNEAEDRFVAAASLNAETMSEAFKIWHANMNSENGESVRDQIVMGRIENNFGLTEAAEKRFRRALDGGSMLDDGSNRALKLLAEIIEKSGNPDIANMLLKYGLELDGTVAAPWSASMSHPQRLPANPGHG